MENILIATSTSLQDQRDATHDVLDLLQEHNLFLKKKKCRSEVKSINYLGLILEKGVTCMDPTKVEGIRAWPRPTKSKMSDSFWASVTSTNLSSKVFQKLQNPSMNSHARMFLSGRKTNIRPCSMPYETW